MNIGLDIDNVITAFDDMVFKEMLAEDKNKRNSGIINKKCSHMTKGMFDWSKEEITEFFANNMERIAKKLKIRKNAKKYMDLMLKDGHKLYLISHRAYPDYKNPMETTINWLKKHNVNYTELVLSKTPDKSEECKKYKIDIMVDDRVSQCKKMIENGINCVVMLTKYNGPETKGLKVASSWENLYKEILEWKD